MHYILSIKAIETVSGTTDTQGQVEWVKQGVKACETWEQKIEVMRASGSVDGFEEVMRETEKRMERSEKVSVNRRIVELTKFSSVKDYVGEMIIGKKLKKNKVQAHLNLILQLLSRNDEYLLMILFGKYLFSSKESNQDLDTLSNFYLGYCQTELQTYEVSEPNFSGKRHPIRHSQSLIH